MAEVKQTTQTADWVLRGSVPLPTDPVIPHEVVGIFVGMSITVLVGVFLRLAGFSNLIVASIVTPLALAVFASEFHLWRRARSRIALFADRLVIHHKDLRHLTITINLSDVSALTRRGELFVVRRGNEHTSFRIDRLHAEDAFDVLAERVTALNSDCVIGEA